MNTNLKPALPQKQLANDNKRNMNCLQANIVFYKGVYIELLQQLYLISQDANHKKEVVMIVKFFA